jgi:hypothetical protein
MSIGGAPVVGAWIAALVVGAQKEPIVVDLLRRLGAVHVRQEAYDSAGQCFDRVLASPSPTAQDWVNRGVAECLAHLPPVHVADFGLALECFRKAQSLDPALADGWSGEAWVLELASSPGSSDERETLLRKARALDPSFAAIPFQLAQIASERDDIDGAIEWFEEAVRMAATGGDPIELPAMYGLARLLKQRKGPSDRDRANRLLESHRRRIAHANGRQPPLEVLLATRVVAPERRDVPPREPAPAHVVWSSPPERLARASPPIRWIDAADVDGDGLDELLVTDREGVLLVMRRETGPWIATRLITGAFRRAVAVDFERLGDTSVLVVAEDGLRVFDPRPWGLFEAETT